MACLHAKSSAEVSLLIPYVKDASFYMGWLFIPFTFLVIVGSSNAVNLTDGLDGLAIMPSVMVAAALGIFAYVTGQQVSVRWRFIVPVLSVRASGFSGSIPTPHKCLWVMSALWRLVQRWVSLLCW